MTGFGGRRERWPPLLSGGLRGRLDQGGEIYTCRGGRAPSGHCSGRELSPSEEELKVGEEMPGGTLKWMMGGGDAASI